MSTIEVIYRCRVEYEYTNEVSPSEVDVEDRILYVLTPEADEWDVEVEFYTGGPACSPYIQIESEKVDAVALAVEKVKLILVGGAGVRLVSS